MSYPNIAVCSYNLNWEIMDLESGNLTKRYSIQDLELFKSNIIANIQGIYDYYNPQIYCFQEATNFKDFVGIFNPEIFSYYVNISGPEYMVTVWDITRFELITKFPAEFESGRPFCIFLFKDLIDSNIIMLINIHAGHIPNTLSSIFEPIQKIFSKTKKFSNHIISRIIIGGDFNRDINDQIKSDPKLFFELNNSIYKFKPYEKPMENTCCSITSGIYKRNYDFVLDSFQPVILRHELNKETWYKNPSSDHLMIMSVLNIMDSNNE